jgi:hypothetical protein
MEDNGLSVQPVTRTFSSPSLGWLPTFSRSRTSVSGTRPQVAKTIEVALGQIAVTKFNAPGRIQYAKGTSTVVFGDFMVPVHQEDRPAVMLTIVDYSRRYRGSVAVCLFGSMDNFPGYIQNSGPRTDRGWTSSEARSVFRFLKSYEGGLDSTPSRDTPGEMAAAALQIAQSQGVYKAAWECSYGMDRPWQRSYTYGDAREAHWLARIYLDMSREDFEAEGINIEDWADGVPIRRVLIGAPLWIRTPDPRAVQLYAHCDDLGHPIDDPDS